MSCDSCSEVPGLEPCLWFWKRGCCLRARLSGAHVPFYLSCLKVFFLLSTAMRSSKHWSWGWSCHAKWKEAEALLWVPHESQSVFHGFPALTRWGEAGAHLQESVMLESKAVFDGRPCVGQKAEHGSEKLSGWPEGRKAILQLPVIGLGVFYLTEFSATSSKAWTLRPSWWCQAEYVLELWYNLCTHTYLPMLSLMHFSLLNISDVSF